MVQQPAGRRNDHVRLLAERDGLLHHVQTAQNQSAPEGNQGPEGLERLGDLGGKFSGRGQDEGEQRLGLVEQGLEDRQGKGGGFAAARLCNADYVAVLQGKGDSLLLDGRRPLVSELVAGVAEGVDDALGLSVAIMGEVENKDCVAYQVLERLWGGLPVSFSRNIVQGGRLVLALALVGILLLILVVVVVVGACGGCWGLLGCRCGRGF